MSIKRDMLGIVIQHDPANVAYADGGDSANRTGILAMCGSLADQRVLPLFEDGNGWMHRHPTQQPWNNPKNCTRDQLIPFVAGCWVSGNTAIAQRLLMAHEARNWVCQNTERDYPRTTKIFPDMPDFLAPDAQRHLRICAGEMPGTQGVATLKLAIVNATTLSPNEEHNQLFCECFVAGAELLRSLIGGHPDFKKNLRDYWAGWRDQPEIADVMWDAAQVRMNGTG